MTQVHQLYKLQQIDTEIREKTQRLKEVLAGQKPSAELLAARTRADTAVANLQEWQAKHKNLRLELESLRSEAKNAERRLYSGKVTNPKELADLQHKIENLGKRIENIEEQVLEAMIMLENAESEETAASKHLEAIQTAWEKNAAELKEEQNVLALQIHKLNGQRQEQAKVIDARDLQEYETLAKKKHGMAIARVRANTCLGCRLTVSANKLREAREGKKVYCGSCGRILFPY